MDCGDLLTRELYHCLNAKVVIRNVGREKEREGKVIKFKLKCKGKKYFKLLCKIVCRKTPTIPFLISTITYILH